MAQPPIDSRHLSVSDIERVLDHAERSPTTISAVFAKLLEQDQDPELVQTYCGAIKQKIERSGHSAFGPKILGFEGFTKNCYDQGLIKTMLAISQDMTPDPRAMIASYQALDSISELIRRGTVAERRACLDQFLEGDGVAICLNKFNHPLCLHRQLASVTLRAFSNECFLGEKLTPSQTCEVMKSLCQYALSGPDSYIAEMNSPTTTWQSQMMLGKVGVSPSRAAKYVPRYYAMAQEGSLLGAHGLLCRSPQPSRQFVYELLQHDPTVIDLVLKCAVIPRPAWYPETQVDSTACELLVMLFDFPLNVVPGIPIPYDRSDWTEEINTELAAMVKSLKMLTSRSGWVEELLSIWGKIDSEKWPKVQKLFKRVQTDYFAQEPPDDESFREIFEYRGVSRISVLRLIANIMLYADECQLKTPDICSLLRVCYTASSAIKSLDQIDTLDENGLYVWVERASEIFRSPMYTVFTQDTVDVPCIIADESVLGPLSLIRTLLVLARRGLLDEISGWTAAPSGTSSSTSLGQIKQITSPEIIRRVVTLAFKRVGARREKGKERLDEKDQDYARVAYTSAAELANTLVALNNATSRTWALQMRGVHKELVLCLGNAAEMALRLKQYKRALGYALCAVSAGVNAPQGEGLDQSTVAKNVRRLEAAKAGLQ